MGAGAYVSIDALGFGPIPFPRGEATIREAISSGIAEGVVWCSQRDEHPVRVWTLELDPRTEAEHLFATYLWDASAGGAGVFDFDVPDSSPTETVQVFLGRTAPSSFSRRITVGGFASFQVTLREVK